MLKKGAVGWIDRRKFTPGRLKEAWEKQFGHLGSLLRQAGGVMSRRCSSEHRKFRSKGWMCVLVIKEEEIKARPQCQVHPGKVTRRVLTCWELVRGPLRTSNWPLESCDLWWESICAKITHGRDFFYRIEVRRSKVKKKTKAVSIQIFQKVPGLS